MKWFSRLITVLLIAGLLWFNFPENFPVNVSIPTIKVDSFRPFKVSRSTWQIDKLNPPKISRMIGGKSITREFVTKLGLDLQGGSHFVFETDTSKLPSADVAEALVATRNIIERRVNLFGVSEPVVQTTKSGKIHRITVDLPGVKDPKSAVDLIGRTAQLTFKEEGAIDPSIPESIATLSAIFKLTKPTGLTGKDVKKAQVVFNQQNGEPNVQLQFTPEGTKLFADITKRNLRKLVGIFLDNDVLTAPVVQSEILDGTAVISGSFTVDSAKELAIAINSGALPVPIKLVEQRTIGATLGTSEVNKSIIAGVVGLSMVVLFMVMFYGRMGVVASLGLLLYGLITHAIYRIVPVVLTLPGIAGFILSVGMAVDANILIFERIKDELRHGKPREVAIRIGFGRAMSAIKDANVTTLLVSFILFNPLNWEFLPQFGLVRGFALTLAIGVIVNLFTGIFVTRRILRFFYR